MKPEAIYPGMPVKIVRLFHMPALNACGNAHALSLRRVGLECRVEQPFTVTPPHMIWWVRTRGVGGVGGAEGSELTIVDCAEIEPANAVAEAVVKALEYFRNPSPPDPAPPGRTFKTQAEAWADGWREAMREVRQRAGELIWEVDPWDVPAKPGQRA